MGQRAQQFLSTPSLGITCRLRLRQKLTRIAHLSTPSLGITVLGPRSPSPQPGPQLFQLPLSGSPPDRGAAALPCSPPGPAFNSLSRDHHAAHSRRDNPEKLSTPSLGITGLLGIQLPGWLLGSFQLPLSGSHVMASDLLKPILNAYFQLPLSGSLC